MDFESEVKAVLRRVDPPPGFADRVMRRVERRRPRRILRSLAAATLIAVAVGGWGVHVTLRARNELLTAMRIASQKVVQAQHDVNRR